MLFVNTLNPLFFIVKGSSGTKTPDWRVISLNIKFMSWSSVVLFQHGQALVLRNVVFKMPSRDRRDRRPCPLRRLVMYNISYHWCSFWWGILFLLQHLCHRFGFCYFGTFTWHFFPTLQVSNGITNHLITCCSISKIPSHNICHESLSGCNLLNSAP